MSEAMGGSVGGVVSDLLARHHALVDDLLALDVTRLADDELLALWRGLETQGRRIVGADHAVIEQVERRGLPGVHGCASTVAFARHLLTIAPGEATARVKAAHAVGPRHTVPGEPLDPIHPVTAAALAAGVISPRHAAVIVDAVAKLPDELAATLDVWLEEYLLDLATQHDPVVLASHARDVLALLDQDGTTDEETRQHRRRELRLRRRPDGSAQVTGELTAEAAEHLQVLFDALAKPEPAADGTPDPRTAGQRQHDALLAGLKLLIGAGTLPDAGGLTATLILTMDVDAYATGAGRATTGHGLTIPADTAKRWAGPETRAILVLLSKTKGIVGYSSTQRLFTEQQRLAMMARDRGCSYPGCDAPAQWTQAHHVTDWQHTHRTSVDDGALVCGANHRTFEQMGWSSVMLDGHPHWVPPDWIDPHRTPRRNTMHDQPQPTLPNPTLPNPTLPDPTTD